MSDFQVVMLKKANGRLALSEQIKRVSNELAFRNLIRILDKEFNKLDDPICLWQMRRAMDLLDVLSKVDSLSDAAMWIVKCAILYEATDGNLRFPVLVRSMPVTKFPIIMTGYMCGILFVTFFITIAVLYMNGVRIEFK